MANFIQFRKARRASTSSVYMQLLSSLASDLDQMLNELCTTPPPPYDRLSDSELPNRQTDYGIGSDGAFLSHTQNIINNDKHKLDGTAFAEKNFATRGPLTAGGHVDYTHKPSASELSLGASNTRGMGTDVTARGQYNFFNSRDGRGKVGTYGEYNRHYGGPYGTQKPNWGAGIRATYNF